MKFKILKQNHFAISNVCKSPELCIANYGFAAESFKNGGDDWKEKVSALSFFYTDSDGCAYKDQKYYFRRATEEEVFLMMTKSLFDVCVKEGIIESLEVTEEQLNQNEYASYE